MKKPNAIFWIGLTLYVGSFFLVGVLGPGSAATRGHVRGYNLAWSALLFPFLPGGSWTQGVMPVLLPCSVFVGLINPIFIAAMVTFLSRRRRAFQILRIVDLVLFPFCWFIFLLMGWLPQAGYFIWVLGMLLALFSGRWDRTEGTSSLFPSASVR